jgi:hypothetical protein
MISLAGVIRGKCRCPYIYAIAKGYCLYIGETQRIPVSRWGEHLSPQGSFMRLLREADEEVWGDSGDMLFVGVQCNEIAALPLEEQKFVSQYLEHKIHEKCILNMHLLLPFEKIISDTLRTAPYACKNLPWMEVLVDQVFKEICERLLEYKLSKV